MSVLGLPANDPLALVPLADMGRTDAASQMQMPNAQILGPLPGPAQAGAQGMAQPAPAQTLPWMEQPPQQNCAIFCLGTNPPAPVQPQLPPEALPPGTGPPPSAPAALSPLSPPSIVEPTPPPAETPPPAQAPVPLGIGPAPGPAA
jgi:hypothetical protein